MKSIWLPEQRACIRFHDFPGDEPAVVLLHGLGAASSADFSSVARLPGLSRYRLILPDFLGFGFSDRPADFAYSLEAHAETVYQILHHRGISSIYLFGHSMGGAVAVALAAAHPKLIRRLVLAEANLDPGIGGASRMIASQTESEYVTRGHREFLWGIEQESRRSPALSGYAGALKLADPIAMHRSAVGLIRGTVPPQRQIFLSITIPRSFIFGEHSLPDPDVDNLQKSNISVFIVPRAGHGMMDENPEGFERALLEAFGL